MLSAELFGLFASAVGTIMGAVGFLPMTLVLDMTHRGRLRPSVGLGLVAVLVSLTFLMAMLAMSWRLAPHALVPLAVGMLVGFFAMCACAVAKKRFPRT